ncbi:hypothetical protein V8E36_009469 [Tilletia maclaganii]
MQRFTLTTLLFALALLAFSSSSNGEIVIHNPVASTHAEGGRPLDVEWIDDGKAPTLRSFGTISVYLCTGSQTVQYQLQQLATNVRASATSGSWRIDPSVGPNSDKYFLRFQGSNLSSAGTPPLGFSARFSLSKMTGTFNSTVQATNQGAVDPGSSSSTRITTAVSASTSTARTSNSSSSPTLKSAVTSGASGTGAAAPALSLALGGVNAAAVAMGTSMLLTFLGAALVL